MGNVSAHYVNTEGELFFYIFNFYYFNFYTFRRFLDSYVTVIADAITSETYMTNLKYYLCIPTKYIRSSRNLFRYSLRSSIMIFYACYFMSESTKKWFMKVRFDNLNNYLLGLINA